MGKNRLDGSKVKSLDRRNKSEIVITLVDGNQLLLKAEPTDYGYDAQIIISRVKKERLNGNV